MKNKECNFIIETIKPYFFMEFLGLIITIFYATSVFITPLASKYIIDNVVNSEQDNNLYNVIFIFFISCILQPVLGLIKDFIFLNISENIIYNIREKMFRCILYAEMKFFLNTKKGEIVSRVLNDCQMFGTFISNIFITYIKDILFIFMIVIGMFYLSFKITIISLSMLILFIFLIKKSGKVFSTLSLIRQNNFDNLCVKTNQTVELIETIKSFVVEKKINKDFSSTNLNNKNNNIRMMKFETIINNSAQGVVIIVVSFIYAYGLILVKHNYLTIGTVIALATYFQTLIQPMFELIGTYINFKKMRPIIKRISEFLNINSDNLMNKLRDNNSIELDGTVDLQNVSFNYENNKKYALQNISINIKNDEMVAILGTAGSGKSTLVNLIMGFYTPQKGVIRIGHINSNNIDKTILRKNIGYIPQNIQLFNDTIKENIRCYNYEISDLTIDKVCKEVGIYDFINSLEKGYDTIINEKVNLSGGQKQLIGIARVLAKNPSILICDEPTSSLDPENENEIVKNIYSLKNKYTIILITHNISIVKDVDKILVLNKGTLEQIGNHKSLVKQSGIYSQFLSKH